MADRYWRGGTGTWNSTNTTNWSATNGGTGGASVPTSADNVFFTSLSGGGTCSISGTVNARDMNMTGYTGTLGGSSGTLNVFGGLIMATGGSWTYAGATRFVGGTAGTWTTNGKTMNGSVLIQKNPGAYITLGGAITVNNTVQLSSLSFPWLDLSTYTLTCKYFNEASNSNSILVFGSGSKIVCNETGNTLNAFSWGAGTYTGTGRVEVLTPPSGSTTNITASGGTGLTAPPVYLVASGTGTISAITSFLYIGAGNYTVGGNSQLYKGFNVDPGFTGTVQSPLYVIPSDATGATGQGTVGLTTIYVSSGSTLYPFTLSGALTVQNIDIQGSSKLVLSSYTLTCTTAFFLSGTAPELDMGSGTIYLSNTGSNTAFDVWAATSLTLNRGTGKVALTTPTSGQTKTVRVPSGHTEAQAFNYEVVAVGTGSTISFAGASGGSICNDLTLAGGSYTLTSFSNFTIYGNLTVTGNITSYTTTTQYLFSKSSGTQTINCVGTFGRSGSTVVFSATGANWSLAGDTPFASATSLNGGTLDLGGYRLTTASFSSSLSTARTIAFGSSGAIRLTGSGTVWTTATATNLTTTGTNKYIEPNLNSAQTLTFGTGLTEAQIMDVSVPSTASNNILTITGRVRNLTFANVAYTVANTAITFYGDVTILGTTPTFTAGANAWTFAATSGTKTITTNGELLDFPLTINSPGATLSLGSALTIGSTRLLTVTAGTLDSNNYSLTIGSLSSNGSGVRAFTFGSSTWTLNGASWDTSTPVNLTINRGTGKISIAYTASTFNFNGGGLTYPILDLATTQTVGVTNTSNTFADIQRSIANSAGITFDFITYVEAFTLKGFSAAARTSVTGPISKSSGIIDSDYLLVTNSAAQGGATWYAGANSVNNGGNTGWIFTAAPSNSGNMLMLFS